MGFLKLFLFLFILLVGAFVGFYCYKWFNKRNIASSGFLTLVGYSLLFILVNFMLLIGGVFLMLRVYGYMFT